MGDLMDAIPRLHPDTGIQRVGGRLMAAGPPDALHTFVDEAGNVSEVAERIVELSDGQHTVRQIVDVLCTEFDVPRPVCERDTLSFLAILRQRQVLVYED